MKQIKPTFLEDDSPTLRLLMSECDLQAQIGAALLITNWGGSYYKLGDHFTSNQGKFITGQILKTGAIALQIGASITNPGSCYKSVQNNCIHDCFKFNLLKENYYSTFKLKQRFSSFKLIL